MRTSPRSAESSANAGTNRTRTTKRLLNIHAFRSKECIPYFKIEKRVAKTIEHMPYKMSGMGYEGVTGDASIQCSSLDQIMESLRRPVLSQVAGLKQP